jgi:phage baseplate assembly protein W
MGTGSQFLDYPFRIGGEGGAALTADTEHVRDLIEQVLLTNPGERVNLPDFGCGLRNLVFAGNSDILLATTKFLITQNLNRWLGATLIIDDVKVRSDDATLLIEIFYTLRQTRERQRLSIQA